MLPADEGRISVTLFTESLAEYDEFGHPACYDWQHMLVVLAGCAGAGRAGQPEDLAREPLIITYHPLSPAARASTRRSPSAD